MNKSVEKEILKIYQLVFNKVFTKRNIANLYKGNRINILNAAQTLDYSNGYTKFAEKFAKELAKKGLRHQRGVWRKFYEVAKKRHYVALPPTYQQWQYEQFSKAVKHNFSMIKSIPQEMIKVLEHKYTSTLIEEVAKGKLARGSFEKQLKSHNAKNAKLIARTETAKLQTAITENRAKDLGSVAYIWLSSNDLRTRPSHKAMNGVVVFWRTNDLEKPHLDNMYGNAGEFPNCRCDPQPIFDEDDLTKSTYKVYNYTTQKIDTMTKKELLTALNKGGLL